MTPEGEQVLEELGEIADAFDRLLQDRERHSHTLNTTLELLKSKKKEFWDLLESQYPMFQLVAKERFAGRAVMAQD